VKRQDIANYLGLTIETVSRILTSLEGCAVIEMPTSHPLVSQFASVIGGFRATQSRKRRQTVGRLRVRTPIAGHVEVIRG